LWEPSGTFPSALVLAANDPERGLTSYKAGASSDTNRRCGAMPSISER
jgi:hypothetical protein